MTAQATVPVQLSAIETLVRQRLIEPSANFWTSDELTQLCVAGIRDLWRSIVDLKGEHFLRQMTDVYYPQNSDRLANLPNNSIHKIYLIEPANMSANSANVGLLFSPRPYKNRLFQLARSQDPISPANDTIWYDIAGAGGPADGITVFCAPQVTSNVPLNFLYIPTLGAMDQNSVNPIPGESDNALVAWTVAYARAKERDDRMPDPAWLQVYSTEKQNLLQSLGLREYQEASYVDAQFEEYWGWLLAAGLTFSQIAHLFGAHLLS